MLPGFRSGVLLVHERIYALRSVVRPLLLCLVTGLVLSGSPSGYNFAVVVVVRRRQARTRTNRAPPGARARQMHAFRSATAAVMSAAGAESAAAAPAREAAGEVASETSDGHAVGGLLMLQPNTATPPTHHPMHPQPMYPPMHQAVPVPVPMPHAPLPDQLPQAAAPPAQMQAMVPMQAGLGHGLPPPMAVAPPPMTTMAPITPIPPPHMQMVSRHPYASNPCTAGAALKRPLDVMHVRPLRRRRRRRRRHRHRPRPHLPSRPPASSPPPSPSPSPRHSPSASH